MPAIAKFAAAATLQALLVLPVRQSLAAALLQPGRLDEALEQFQQALRRAPNNGWTYYGLAQLHKARGNPKAARAAEAQLANTWIDRGHAAPFRQVPVSQCFRA